MPVVASFDLSISYNQFMVWDRAVERLPGLAWTSRHFTQGFARRESVVNLGTLIEYGSAKVEVEVGPYVAARSSRVVAVPFRVVSGEVTVEGPEERGREPLRIAPGTYLLYACQRKARSSETVRLVFEPTPKLLERSRIVVRDAALEPVEPLLETADIAEF